MSEPPVQLMVGGQNYRVHSDATPDHLQRLATELDARVRACNSNGRLSPTQALLYAALTLVDDLERETQKRRDLQASTRERIRTLLARVDAALETTTFTPDSPFARPLHPETSGS